MTAAAAVPHPRARADLPHPRRARPWLVLAVLGTAQLMLALDATVVNIALPRAQASLGFSDGDRQWVVTAYSLAFGSLLLIGGRLADTFGQRRMFVVGLTGFAAASAVGGAADGLAMLVAARALQGAFGAVLAPAALSLLTLTFTEGTQRARAFGIFGATSAVGGSIGLVLGGLLTEYVDWRWVMYVNVLVAAAAVAVAVVLLPAGRRGTRQVLDLRGALLAAAGVFAVVYGLSRASSGSGVRLTLAEPTGWLLVAGPVLLSGFVLAQRRATHPLLPLRIVRDRERGAALLAMFLSASGVFGILLFLTYYLERVLGYSPVRAGLAFVPMAVTLVVLGSVGNAALNTRVPPRTTVPFGLLIASGGMALLTRIGPEPQYLATVLPATLVTALGLGLVFSPCFNLGTSGVKVSDAGIAAATVHVAQQVGGSVGTALLNSSATTAAAGYLATHGGAGSGTPVHTAADLHSYTVVFWLCAATLAVAAVLVRAVLGGGQNTAARRRLVVVRSGDMTGRSPAHRGVEMSEPDDENVA